MSDDSFRLLASLGVAIFVIFAIFVTAGSAVEGCEKICPSGTHKVWLKDIFGQPKAACLQ